MSKNIISDVKLNIKIWFYNNNLILDEIKIQWIINFTVIDYNSWFDVNN